MEHLFSYLRRIQIFRPPQPRKLLTQTRQRQAHNIEIAAFDPWNIPACATLNRIGARLVERLAGGQITRDLLIRNLRKVYVCGLDEAAPLSIRQSHQRHPGQHRMRPAGKLREHLACVFAGARLAQYVPVEHHLGIRGNNNGRPNSTRGDKLRLSVRKSLHQFRRRFTRDQSLVYSRRQHSERHPSIMQDFRAANRSGSKNQFHAAIRRSILQNPYLVGAQHCCAPAWQREWNYRYVCGVRRTCRRFRGCRNITDVNRQPTPQITTDSWYSPKARRNASEISPTVA